MRIDWAWICNQIIDELLDKPPSDRTITLSLDDLLHRAGAVGNEPKGLRRRSYWANALQGKGAWATARRAGLSINLVPDEPGADVGAVTFRFDEQRPETYCITGIRPDESREVIGNGLTRDEAAELFFNLLDSKEFAAFHVEKEP